MYHLRIKQSAEHDLRRLPRLLFERINQHILELRTEPRPSGALKLRGEPDGWRIRIGDYRVVDLIDDKAELVTIVRVKHRREVYR